MPPVAADNQHSPRQGGHVAGPDVPMSGATENNAQPRPTRRQRLAVTLAFVALAVAVPTMGADVGIELATFVFVVVRG